MASLSALAVALSVFALLDGRFPGSTLFSQVLVLVTGQTLISAMILLRADFRARWGERAYGIAFRWLAIPGLILVFAGIAHFAWIEGPRILPPECVLFPALYLLATGVVLWVRSITVLGIDTLTLMYVYYPAESRLVDSAIYSILRHPIYSAVLRIGLALALWNGTPLALFAGVIALLWMATWVRLVEERELVERLGEPYRRYRQRTPAFFNLDPRSWPVLWKFLLLGR